MSKTTHENTFTKTQLGSVTVTIASVDTTDVKFPCLICKISLTDNTITVDGITFESKSFVFVGRDRNANAGSELWVLKAPPEATGDVVITLSGACNAAVACSVYSYVNPRDPVNLDNITTADGSDNSPTLNILALKSEMLVDSLAQTSAGPDTATADHTERHNIELLTIGDDTRGASQELFVGASGVKTMGWSMSGSDSWALVAAALIPFPSGSGYVAAAHAGLVTPSLGLHP